MTTYYLDTSALSKRYVREPGTDLIRALVAPGLGHSLVTARASMVEFYSALARRRREGSVPTEECDVAERAFIAHSISNYDFIELDLRIVELARELLKRHVLRAYDAVQLASALVANNALQSAQLPPLTFLSADDHLNEAARAEGLAVNNPNLYS